TPGLRFPPANTPAIAITTMAIASATSDEWEKKSDTPPAATIGKMANAAVPIRTRTIRAIGDARGEDAIPTALALRFIGAHLHPNIVEPGLAG
ncbi:MAG TPA: hypothetical protein VEJ20_08685, partial [Candidatus Eremiobacteraceae bacterium]|nr:hypothetical protein [Candidatus Eremiobacteraceae bacterium]